jgi:hypothetical protein
MGCLRRFHCTEKCEKCTIHTIERLMISIGYNNAVWHRACIIKSYRKVYNEVYYDSG